MGTKNRERRAAKKKARDRARGRDHDNGQPGAEPFEEMFAPTRITPTDVATAVREAAVAHVGGDTDALTECGAVLMDQPDSDARTVDRGLDLAVTAVVEQLWQHGWLPLDLVEHAGRALSAAQAELVADLVAVQVSRYADASLHPRWRESIERAGVGRDRRPAGSAVVPWAARHGRPREDAAGAVLTIVAMIYSTPQLPTIVPAPGTEWARRAAKSSDAHAGVDPKVLARVRALLAKAESTGYAEEAEALSSKAQELMNRHALEQAVIDAQNDTGQAAITVRLWLDGPYVAAKSMLVSAVADANRCASVRSSALDMVSIVGHESDLDAVELLVTSLLVQANRAMLQEGRSTGAGGRSRSRSFRQSFLIAYAERIGERLRLAAAQAQNEVADERLLPVLAARASAVEETLDEVFGELTRRSVSINDVAGWNAGRAAAESASLGLDRERLDR